MPQLWSSIAMFGLLGAVMVSVLAIGPKVRGFNLSRGNGLLRAIKIRSTPSFKGAVAG
jgi:hypothetical protein